ncbi:MAG: DUF1295 domain-containing protein [Gemmataceae bacterium]
MTHTSLLFASVLFLGFVAALFLGSKVLPGRVRLGAALADGNRLPYKLNGLMLFVLTWLVVALGERFQLFSLSVIYTHFWSLLIVANVFSLAVSLLLWRAGRRQPDVEAATTSGRRRPARLRDFWYGVELNPRWFGVDLKMFSYRPSLIGLGLMVAAFAAVQYQRYGFISGRMWLFQAFWFLYLANYFQFEHGMLYTWDIIAERFGFMLIWGDYVVVPFFYSVAGWYLVDQVEPLPVAVGVGLVLLFLIGFILFRGANGQKHRYKMNPQAHIWGKPAETLGGRLLVSGFWGIGRKLNYTGELCLYFAIALTTGWVSIVPYLLPLWLTGLLVHRAGRDEQRCREKYGSLWNEYCQRARFRMFPYIY